jgi:hypothetical protein
MAGDIRCAVGVSGDGYSQIKILASEVSIGSEEVRVSDEFVDNQMGQLAAAGEANSQKTVLDRRDAARSKWQVSGIPMTYF